MQTYDTSDDINYDSEYNIMKEPRAKIVKGIIVKSGRTVRFTNNSNFWRYSDWLTESHPPIYEPRYSDNSRKHKNTGCAGCSGHHNVCARILDHRRMLNKLSIQMAVDDIYI
jgi:hypothetical protein